MFIVLKGFVFNGWVDDLNADNRTFSEGKFWAYIRRKKLCENRKGARGQW